MQNQIRYFLENEYDSDMDPKLKKQYERNTDTICRTGCAWNPTDLKMCSIETARSIIINLGNDDKTIKAIMACNGILHELHMEDGENDTYIAAVIRKQSNMDAARIAGGKFLEVVCYEDLMSRIISSSSRSAGLSCVITELFNYKDNEIYTVKPEDIDTTGMEGIEIGGLSPYDLNLYFENAIAIGGLKDETCNHLKKGKLANRKFSSMDSCLFPSVPEKMEEKYETTNSYM